MAGVAYNSTVTWEGGRVTRAVGIAAMVGVNMATEYLKSLAVPLAPLDRGPLRASAKIRPATENLSEAWLIFDTPYAAIQHEALDYHHDDGQAKYVEEPMRSHQRELTGIMAREVARGIANA